MDELDLLKKDWKKQESSYPALGFDEISSMLHKKSSSIVKWLLIICIAELLFWTGLNLLVPESYLEFYEKFHLKTFLTITQSLHYVIVLVFIYLFYKNYKAISVTENVSLLMKRIMKTRKTVNYYVYYNIVLYIILTVVVNIIMFSNPELLLDLVDPDRVNNIDEGLFFNIMLITQIVTLILIVALLWIFYRVIYGILVKRLKRNYNELKSKEF